jgi:hypothetical protein
VDVKDIFEIFFFNEIERVEKEKCTITKIFDFAAPLYIHID